MDSFMKMLSTQALMLIYMCVGYYSNKKKIIDKPTEIKLTDFVLQITMPCMIFNSFNMKLTVEFMKEASVCLAIAFFICGIAYFIPYITPNTLISYTCIKSSLVSSSIGL